MSTSKTHRRGHEEKNRKGRLAQRSSSFHSGIPMTMAPQAELRRPKTLPDLLSGRRSVSGLSPEGGPRLTKLLLNVTVQRSLGPVQVVMSPDSTVGDLIAAVLRQYAKEGRRLVLPTTDPAGFDLHYSQFSLESLDRNEKLMTLGSRNFFLCCKKSEPDVGESAVEASETTSSSTCSTEADKVSKISVPWLKFIDFLF
ncbi:hypothetical protein CK203_068392 [Vitis vinifera]|uniref:DUF7054 domain-containing protein n=2 Tax=Vitis TaxID=3603 RepID=A0A438F309_VITVI|nr:hypothetical protein CK203_068392 [Vitis vinifera]